MKRDFDTVIFSPALQFFANKFVERWKLKLVRGILATDVNIFKGSKKPIIIVGGHFSNPNNAHSVHFRKILDKHKGPQVILLGGAGDTNLCSVKYVKNRNKHTPTYMLSQDDKSIEFLESVNMGHDKIYIPLKSYLKHKPIKLGNKIWFHVGFSGKDNVKARYGFDTVVKPIIKEFGRNRVGFINPNGPTRSEDFLHEKYSESFVYVKPNPDHGSTTMWEMGNMGRRTICTGHKELNNVVVCPSGIKEGKHIDALIALIKKEESRIGTLQLDVAKATKACHIQNDSWLQLKFWNEWNK